MTDHDSFTTNDWRRKSLVEVLCLETGRETGEIAQACLDTLRMGAKMLN